ncbi:polyphosphate kinase 1 [Cytophagaceae bacterium YF14B1]|uniref:Polyphosphate kinase n=1 Tax=Xanthocytophaga flava TaxID=3048013 RepID=A0AAE3U7J8_9BACT|nr:polyphosphate kinase 1 [Xanthocytophaga flavus]MDJ1483014.1 polyphosphate kinase 1 [Xanthocytophaga flavus]
MNSFAHYFNRDLSWLSFNYRVLQEANNSKVPLFERIRFLSIFSSNLDEFFRVRMRSLQAITQLSVNEELSSTVFSSEEELLKEVQHTIIKQQEEFGLLLTQKILPELQQQSIHLYYKEDLSDIDKPFISEYFFSRILSFLQPEQLTPEHKGKIQLTDNVLYFILAFSTPSQPEKINYSLLNIPHSSLPRFFKITHRNADTHILFLDDIIREYLPQIFPNQTIQGCYCIKVNQNADIDIADEFSGEIDKQIAKMLEDRQASFPTRFLYDESMPTSLQQFLADYFVLNPQEMIAGGRYHNLKDLSSLPLAEQAHLNYPPQPPLHHKDIDWNQSIFTSIEQGDRLLHFPYQSYNYVLRFFNEAAIDPTVEQIMITLYRIASDSFIANALISAAKNGKKVTVFVELKARFDEANNLKWAKKMQAAGIHLVYSIPSMKVHAKIALVKRKASAIQTQCYGLLATGNFNESTARFYTDHALLTCHEGIMSELDTLFTYLQSREQPVNQSFSFQHLLVAPFNLQNKFESLIDQEIANHQAGLPARITIKLNNLQERHMIDKLYEASKAGVPVDLIVRGICCLIPQQKNISPTITVRRIVDRYLEHARVFIFHNNGQPQTFLGSADWMNRNIHRRVEVCFPLYNPTLQSEIQQIIQLQLADNQQACSIDQYMKMHPIRNSQLSIQAQQAIYSFLKEAQQPVPADID